MQTASMTDKTLADYLMDYCRTVQGFDASIRFAGLADYSGKLQGSFYRSGLVPLMNRGETEQYALQSVFRARTRGGFKPQLGEQRYALAVYDNLIRSTIAITNSEAEHHNLYLLVSLDIDSQYPRVLQKIVSHIANTKAVLFERTRKLSQGYTD